MKKLKVLRKDLLQMDFPVCMQHHVGVEAARPFLHTGSLNSIGKTLSRPLSPAQCLAWLAALVCIDEYADPYPCLYDRKHKTRHSKPHS